MQKDAPCQFYHTNQTIFKHLEGFPEICYVFMETVLGWESITERGKFLGLSLFHKIHIGDTRPLVKSCLPPISSSTLHNTRQKTVYNQFHTFCDTFNKSFSPTMPNYGNVCHSKVNRHRNTSRHLTTMFLQHPLRYAPVGDDEREHPQDC